MYIFLLICCHFIFDQKNVRSRNRNSSLQMKRTGPWYSIMFNIIFSPIIQMSPTHASEFSVVLVCTLHFSNNLICHNIPHQLKASSMMCKHLKSHVSSPINMPLVKMKIIFVGDKIQQSSLEYRLQNMHVRSVLWCYLIFSLYLDTPFPGV